MKEIFVDIKGYEGLYQVSNFGRVKSLPSPIKLPHGGFGMRKEKFLKPGTIKGYLGVVLTKDSINKGFSVHRLVATAFINNPENKEQVNHINSIKKDNRVENLEWVTRSENLIHSYNAGTHPSKEGILNGRSKLTENQIVEIKKEALNSNINTIKLWEKYNVSRSTINRIVSGETWSHIN